MPDFENMSSTNTLPNHARENAIKKTELQNTELQEDQPLGLEAARQSVAESTVDFDNRHVQAIERMETTLDIPLGVIKEIADQHGITVKLKILKKQLENFCKVFLAENTTSLLELPVVHNKKTDDNEREGSGDVQQKNKNYFRELDNRLIMGFQGICDIQKAREMAEKIENNTRRERQLIKIAKLQSGLFEQNSEEINFIYLSGSNIEDVIEQIMNKSGSKVAHEMSLCLVGLGGKENE